MGARGAGAAPDSPHCAWASPRGCPQQWVAPGSTGRAAGGGLGGSRWSIPLRHHGSHGISPADRCHIATETWSSLPGNHCLVLLPHPSSPAWNFPCRCAPVRNIWKHLPPHPGPRGAQDAELSLCRQTMCRQRGHYGRCWLAGQDPLAPSLAGQPGKGYLHQPGYESC